ncbi:MAG: hypothetical protein JWO19_1627 [Bryobacterales bacterium]|nr:hypothetical protein [Bryobacterales bacterium]
MFFREKDYFKEKAGITTNDVPNAIKHEAAVALPFTLFPVTKWPPADITEDHVFDAIEFFHDYVSKPGEAGRISDDSGFNYWDYLSYDEDAGRTDYRKRVNAFLVDYKSGFEITKDGMILALGSEGLKHILDADIVPYDEVNVDSKVRSAITKWRNRHLGLAEKKEAIRELADVFEWLKKSKGLSTVLDGKDESAIFELANNFAIRHHDPKQKRNYDQAIWYSWIFHFYLATYHATVRLLIKHEGDA